METVSESVGDSNRIQAYMRTLGMDDSNARRLSQQVIHPTEQGAYSELLELAVLDDLFCRKEDWFDALNARSSKEQLPGTDPLVGWRLRMILRQYPEAFLGKPSSKLLELSAQLSDSRPVPQIRQSDMPNQPLGKLPICLQREFWQAAISLLMNTCHKLSSRLRRK